MSSWMRVTGAAPCGVCGKSDWCSISRDGSYAICRRHDDGRGRAKVDRGGGEYWVYRLTDPHAPSVTWTPAPSRAAHAVDPAHLHRVYSAILAALSLGDLDRADLRARGLSDVEINARGYRTLGAYDRKRAMICALKEYGEAECLKVPGVLLRRENRDSYVCLAGAPGLLIPVRNSSGEIVALKLRRRHASSPRYMYLSSVATGGPGPGAPVHVPQMSTPFGAVVRVTEGELKADVATALTGILTLSIAGVGTWRQVLPTLRELGVRTCRLAFDADARTNRHVATALRNLAEHLVRDGFDLELETWDSDHKGIDDCLAAGVRPRIWSGAAALEECRRGLSLALGMTDFGQTA